MKLSEQLEAAFALIDSEDKWCQNMYAADKNNEVTLLNNKAACKFCTMGAIKKAVRNKDNVFVRSEFRRLTGINYIGQFNDTHTYAEVREVWLKAIAKAKEEEK